LPIRRREAYGHLRVFRSILRRDLALGRGNCEELDL
jgi:hypothetical protein